MSLKKFGATGNALEFFRSLFRGREIEPVRQFRGLRLKDRSPEEMICDCCSDDGCGQDDCCGFN